MEFFSSTDIGRRLQPERGRSTVITISQRLGIEPLRVTGGHRLFNEQQANEIIRAFTERSEFKKPGRKTNNSK
jgi:hypothetical protein